MACAIELSFANLVLICTTFVIVRKLIKLYKDWKVEKMLEKWETRSKGKLIVHNIGKCRAIPNMSPYGLKLDTYLRMSKIPYELDTEDVTGPKGKLPWITDNGTHVADSQFCVEYLRKKYNVDLNGKYSEEELALARTTRVMLEDRTVWGIPYYRISDLYPNRVRELRKFPLFILPLIRRGMMKRLTALGVTAHTATEIYQITNDDLRAVSKLLGRKKFILGDEACEDDAAIFGVLAECLWGSPGSLMEKLMNEECTNLKEYCERMKETYWPDWESRMGI